MIVDPAVPATMPPHITANTGMNVLAHAVEAFTSTGASNYTDVIALKAIEMVCEYLPKAYENGDDMVVREKINFNTYGLSLHEIALRFTAYFEGVHSCIVGTSNLNHLKEI